MFDAEDRASLARLAILAIIAGTGVLWLAFVLALAVRLFSGVCCGPGS